MENDILLIWYMSWFSLHRTLAKLTNQISATLSEKSDEVFKQQRASHFFTTS